MLGVYIIIIKSIIYYVYYSFYGLLTSQKAKFDLQNLKFFSVEDTRTQQNLILLVQLLILIVK